MCIRDRIEGATVRIGDEAATTDEQGYYSLDVDEDDDPQTFRVEAVGYSDVADERRVTGDVNPAYVDFNLRPADGPPPPRELSLIHIPQPPKPDQTADRPPRKWPDQGSAVLQGPRAAPGNPSAGTPGLVFDGGAAL